MDMEIKMIRKRRTIQVQPMIRWRNLNAANKIKIPEEVTAKRAWEISAYTNIMWSKTADIIRYTAQKVLGVSNGSSKSRRGAWWWNEQGSRKS